jgi:hypothetical protein
MRTKKTTEERAISTASQGTRVPFTKRQPLPFVSELPLENRAPFGRFLLKDIHFIPWRLWLSFFDKDFFQIHFVKVVLPGKHQFISCLVLISGRNFVNVHDGKVWHEFLPSFFFILRIYSSEHAVRMAHWPVKKKRKRS